MRTFEKYANLNLLWIFPIIVPLGTILLSFYLQEWYWGLMDDATILSMGRTVVERFANDFGMRGFSAGRMQFTFSLRSAIFYTWFEHNPVLLHVSKWVEACLMLAVWGNAVRKISIAKSAALIFVTVALSFHYLHDTFFFVSTHEVLGLLFWGLALNFFLGTLEAGSQTRLIILWALGLLCSSLAITTKEPMVAVGVALGLSLVLLSIVEKHNSRQAFLLGSLVFTASLGYALLLRFGMTPSAHASSYSLTNAPRILGNFSSWVSKNLVNHSPWLVIVIMVGFAAFVSKARMRLVSWFTPRQKWGMVIGLLLYGGYFLIILPWNTTAYYAGPLGVFFAIPIAIIVAQILPQTSIALQVFTPVAALLFNMLVSQWALARESLYHYDTQNLMAWIQGNPAFQAAARGKLVYCNAMEGRGAIPTHLGRDFGVSMPVFKYQGLDQNRIRSGEIMVYTPRFGSSTDIFAPNVWDTMFYSKYWQVYVHK